MAEHRDRDQPKAPRPISRRQFLGAGLATAGGMWLTSAQAGLVERALAATPTTNASLNDIEHVVILMQENRSFDHYFGTLSGVHGFSDRGALTQKVGGVRYPVFDQFGYAPVVGPDPAGYLQPFHLQSDPPLEDGETTNDITHAWGPQHAAWNSGAMDSFVREHLANDGSTNGFLTMGYFTRSDLAFYYALADAFTICDHYFCSVLGPTDPNRVMSIAASLDPSGLAGGPVLETYTNRAEYYGTLTLETMPERLSAAGVSWKVYNDPTALLELSPFPYFHSYWKPSTPSEVELASQALLPSYPTSFIADVASGNLPSVSWIMPPLAECEHPAAPPEYGEYLVQQILDTLVSNPDIWASTVFFVVYDENGGFFDHIPPVTAPPGTPGEWVTASPLPAAAAGIAGPIGLGFRVPCLVVSPFSRRLPLVGNLRPHLAAAVPRDALGVEVPNLSSWRRNVTGDLTTALTLRNPPNPSVPPLPPTSLGDTTVFQEAVINALAGTADLGLPYPPPEENVMPAQESSSARPPVPR